MATADKGTTRSGNRFQKLNVGYYETLEELKRQHSRLFIEKPGIETRLLPIVGGQTRGGSLAQTLVRFRFNSPLVVSTLYDVFTDLFQQHGENTEDGFEVQVTFNLILFGEREGKKAFHVFYGLQHGNVESRVSDRLTEIAPVIVRNLVDIRKIKTTFDSEDLLRMNRDAFRDSNVQIHSFINVNFLIHRFVSAEIKERKKRVAKNTNS